MSPANVTRDLRDDRIGRAVEEYLESLENGEPPQLEELIKRYPDVEDVLRSVIPALQLADRSADERDDAIAEVSVNRKLGDFQILHQLGRGGMGVVYEAEQISMGRRVALKVLPLAGLADNAKIQRFRNEVRAVAALDHPNIVSVFSVGEERGIHYFAMQLIRGQSLAQVVRSLRSVRDDGQDLDGQSVSEITRTGTPNTDDEPTQPFHGDNNQTLPAEQLETAAKADDSTIPSASRREYFRSVAALGIQTADALQHAHDQGVIHRDIKPANLLLDSSSKLYVTDFGLARVEADAGVTMTGDLIGTLRYMAPEQALPNES